MQDKKGRRRERGGEKGKLKEEREEKGEWEGQRRKGREEVRQGMGREERKKDEGAIIISYYLQLLSLAIMYTGTPVLHYTNTPPNLYTGTPVHNTPVHRCTDTPKTAIVDGNS